MKQIKHFISNFEEYVLMITLPLMTLITVAGTTVRYLELGSLTWSEEAARYLMIISAYAGISLGFKHDTHLGMGFVMEKLPKQISFIFRIIRNVIILFFALGFSYFSFGMVTRLQNVRQVSPAMQIPMWVVYTPMVVGFLLVSVRAIQMIIKDIRIGPKIVDNINENEAIL